MWADRKMTRKIKATTIHRELSIVKAILNWAAYIRRPPLIPFNPIDKYKMPKRDDEIIPPPTGSEIKKMYEAASPHVRRAIVLCYNPGTRAGESELFRVCWEHVDFGRDLVTVISARKGGLTQRRVPIQDELRPFFIKWRNEDADRYGCDPELLAGPIIRYKGKPILRIKKA
jgi:integrase